MKIFQLKAVSNAIVSGKGLAHALYKYHLTTSEVDESLGEKEGYCQGQLDKQSGKKKKPKLVKTEVKSEG